LQILATFKDIYTFLFVVAITILGVANALFLLFDETSGPFSSFSSTLFYCTNSLLFQSYDPEVFDDSNRPILASVTFILAMLLVAVVLLNLLIGGCSSHRVGMGLVLTAVFAHSNFVRLL
jgi:hypothetical protein